MNIETIQVLCDLMEMQNFSRTAEKHGISQSAVSQQLAQVEMLYKCQLINRKKRPLRPTSAGEVFYSAGRDILQRYESLSSELSNILKITSKITVSAIFSLGMHTLQPYVKKFMEMFPAVNLSVEFAGVEQIYTDVLKGHTDIGVVALPYEDRNLIVYPFENEPLMLACSPEHSFANQSSIEIHKLEGLKFIAFEKNLPTRKLIDGILERYNVKVRVVMEFDNVETIKRAVEINAGISILPKPAIRAESAGGIIKEVMFSNDSFYRPTGVIVRKDRNLTQAGRYFIELLRKK